MKKHSIVVMGGSFNPPTIAHFRIMQAALDAVRAETGYLVPVSFPYLKRKMIRAGQSHLALADALRLRMLEAMCESDARIRIYSEAMDLPFSDDVSILDAVREAHPQADIYYVLGDDKLDLLDSFSRKRGFFDRFRCILFSRNSSRLIDEIAGYAHLAGHEDAFVPVDSLPGMDAVSSTAIRDHLFDIDAVADMLHPAVVPILRELKQEAYPEEIIRFRDACAFLANDFPAEVCFEGIRYPCAASAFLASKCGDAADRLRISRMRPDKAAQKYSALQGDALWQENQTAIMENIVRLKFSQNPELAQKLCETGGRRLLNGSNNSFWGINPVTWKGENRLGIILMNLRKELTEDTK